uniref:Uncharacterized protein n=1 Tax=candidate division WOR-3 bacterium TaxID=2052148 RepID=A0A7C4UFX9_UNCW3
MEGKSPFEEIFETKKKDKETEESFIKEEEETPFSKYLNLIIELIKKKYYFEAIEVIKELATQNF